jgi:hypothetical protein
MVQNTKKLTFLTITLLHGCGSNVNFSIVASQDQQQ